MATFIQPSNAPLSWKKSLLWLAVAVTCFHLAYTSLKFPAAGLFIFGYALGLVQLTNQPTVRRAFYFGLVTAYLCYAPQTFFMWSIFGPFAIVLWLVLAFWIGLFAAIVCGCNRRWGRAKTAWLIPIIWTGIDYFRSELYYLKFSWLNIGYALPFPFFGMYGCGFFLFAVVIAFFYSRLLKITFIELLLIIAAIAISCAFLLPALAQTKSRRHPTTPITLVGVQMEFPPQNIIPKILTQALAKNTNAQIFVLSEYTLDGGVPDSLKN